MGECESVITDAHSTAYILKDKVKNLYERTVRYPGHWQQMNVLSELGFFDNDAITVDGLRITPRAFTEKILAPKMVGNSNEDITVLRVEVSGVKDGRSTKYTWQMVDFYDHGRNITSMAKTTAIAAALMAKWIAKKKVSETGVIPIESIIVGERFEPFIEEMKRLGINIDFNEEVLV